MTDRLHYIKIYGNRVPNEQIIFYVSNLSDFTTLRPVELPESHNISDRVRQSPSSDLSELLRR